MGHDSTELDIKAKTRYSFINSRVPVLKKQERGGGSGGETLPYA
jgi:hypothetical protein